VSKTTGFQAKREAHDARAYVDDTKRSAKEAGKSAEYAGEKAAELKKQDGLC